jgi:hypothetical protein
MTMEVLYLTTQLHRWLNLQVARHLETQAAKLTPSSPQGIGMSGLNGRAGGADMPETIYDLATLAPDSRERADARQSDQPSVHA